MRSAFLAYWDDRDPFESVPNNNDIFGWVSVTPRSTTGLEVVEGVTAIGAGIVVGTQMIVLSSQRWFYGFLGGGTNPFFTVVNENL